MIITGICLGINVGAMVFSFNALSVGCAVISAAMFVTCIVLEIKK